MATLLGPDGKVTDPAGAAKFIRREVDPDKRAYLLEHLKLPPDFLTQDVVDASSQWTPSPGGAAGIAVRGAGKFYDWMTSKPYEGLASERIGLFGSERIPPNKPNTAVTAKEIGLREAGRQ